MNPIPAEWQALFQAALDGEITAEQAVRLNELLRSDLRARDLYLELADEHSCLAVDEQLWSEPRDTAVALIQIRTSWLAWRPLAAAAAGLVIGLLCATAVWAYVIPLADHGIKLLSESFETASLPLTEGMPLEAGRWSGDETEIVSEQHGVQPEAGKKMLRLVRADYQSKETAGGYVANVYRLIDLRPYRSEFAGGEAVVQCSAGFNSHEFPAAESYRCIASLHALDAAAIERGGLRERQTLNAEALAMTTSSRLMLDREPATWQRQTAELRLPPNTEFLLVHVGLAHGTKLQRRADFDGHYLDEVRVVLTRRAPLP